MKRQVSSVEGKASCARGAQRRFVGVGGLVIALAFATQCTSETRLVEVDPEGGAGGNPQAGAGGRPNGGGESSGGAGAGGQSDGGAPSDAGSSGAGGSGNATEGGTDSGGASGAGPTDGGAPTEAGAGGSPGQAGAPGGGGDTGEAGSGGNGNTPPIPVACADEPTNGFNFRCSASAAASTPGGTLSVGSYRLIRWWQTSGCAAYQYGAMTIFQSNGELYMRFMRLARVQTTDAGTLSAGTLLLEPGPSGAITRTEMCDPALEGTSTAGQYQQGIDQVTFTFADHQEVWERIPPT